MNSRWTCLDEINRDVFGRDPLQVAFDCFSVFAENKGIVVVISDEEIVSFKLSVTDDPEKPLKLLDFARIRGVNGLTVVRDDRNTFLLTEEKKIFCFKSYKRIFELEGFTDVKYFNYNNSCYIIIKQCGVNVKLELYSSFGDETSDIDCEFDLSFLKDSVSIGGSRDTEKNCVELVKGPLEKVRDKTFFSELFACDIDHESIYDVLLMSSDDKLMWVKYKNSFKDGAIDGFQIETIATTKGIIRGIKYCDGFLMALDDLSVLTIFRICPTTKLIRKKEIILEGQVKCFRFHRNSLIYSNLKKVIFIDATNPNEPSIHKVNLPGIVCFSVEADMNFIVAICRNGMFYHLPMNQQHRQPSKKTNELERFQDSDIEKIPSVVKYLEHQEQNLLTIEQQTVGAQKLKILLRHLMAIKDFTAGEAVVRFHLNIPRIPDDAIVCKVTDQKLGSGFIEVTIDLPLILVSMNITIAFNRHGSSGVSTRMLKVNNTKAKVHILMPAETDDDASNKMNLDLHLNYVVKSETRLIIHPIIIKQVISFEGPRVKLRDDLDDCLEMIDKMKTF